MHRSSQRAVLAILFIAMAGCFGETTDASYKTAADAVAKGMVEKGWLPPWLPEDATGLLEVHNIDSNVSELSFEIPDGTSVRLPADCKPVEYTDTVSAYIRRRWWPSEQALQSSYTFFRCSADATEYKFVGLSKDGQRVLHWRTYAR